MNRDQRAADRGDDVRSLSRREFVRGGALAAGAALGLLGAGRDARAAEDAPPEAPKPPAGTEAVRAAPIPKAVLGRTGVEVSILGLGTALLGHQNNNRPEIPKLVRVFAAAIDRGVTYVDTARIYGGAEEALKEVLATRRDKVFLATKVWAETWDEAEKSFHESLATMGVEHVDVLHLHHAGGKDIDKVLGEKGSWEFIQKAKKDGKARFTGITGHARTPLFVRMLETGSVDVMMVAMNFVDRHVYGFEEKVLPEARKQKTGVMAMKVYGGVRGGFKNYPAKTPHPAQLDAAHHRRSIAYVKSLEGVTGMVIGVHDMEQLEENIARVLETKPLSKEEFARVSEEGKAMARDWEPRFGPAV